ncbi:MAG: hypothetical protein QOE36_2812, partial [Gaiellaceae bacterium]|nr:hypothetical protein [Gaiellaceae bacterium]
AAGEHLLAPARERMLVEGLAPQRDLVRIEKAQLGTSAGLIGAGFVGFEALDAAA